MRKLTSFFIAFFLASAFMLQAQTMDYKTGYKFPTASQDSVLEGLSSIRGSDSHPNPLGNGVAAFVVTNYSDNGHVHLFKAAGDDSMELVWSSPKMDSTYGSVAPRYVMFGDLDNDNVIEIIVPHDRNGILIYEWDEEVDSWNFGTQPSRAINSPTTYPVDSVGTAPGNGYARVEYMEIGDYDGDGENELIVASNARDFNFDRYYIFSVSNDYSTNDPGFSVVTRENGIWAKSGSGELGSKYGGGSPYAMIGANLDGIGNDEILVHPWNNASLIPVRVPSANTYLLADTTGGKGYLHYKGSQDAVSLGGGSAFDVDKDGREEIYLPLYDSDINGEVLMIHYEVGDDLSKIDSSNVFSLDLSSVYSSGSFYGRPGFGDYDSDGKPNLYFAGRHNHYIVSSEFQGGEKTDPGNWIHEVLYTGDELDSKIFSSITTTDSAGVIVVDSTLQEDTEGTIAFKISANYSDFDGDNFEDIIMPTQAWKDSIDIKTHTWLKDTSWTVYDTSYAGTDSMSIDTLALSKSIFDTLVTRIVEPNRISLRMLESSTINSLESKELTVITPNDYKLKQNYPNPFNPETNIEFFLPIKKKISLTIYNTVGQKVKTLINNEVYNHGNHTMQWNGTNQAGNKVATGMYIYELKYGNFKKNKRMMLIK